jgi:hypothetical protein
METGLNWKTNWMETQERLTGWWNGEGFAISLEVKRAQPREGIQPPAAPEDLEIRWLDPRYRCDEAEGWLAQADYWAEAFPYFDTQIGPGSLGLFLGAKANLDQGTVWYDPCITKAEPDSHLAFDPLHHPWLDIHARLIEEGLHRSKGRYLVGMPDLIEGLDTLAALRGNERLLYDLVDRSDWVLERLEEINQAYFAVFDFLYQKIKDERGGNAFSAFKIWGPGKTAKVQCDLSAALSPRMFRKFVQPFLAAQCRWLDYSLYHLDGTNALQHLDLLLQVDGLNGIEWTPQAGRPGGGDPCWYELYRRIRAGGKSVQAVGVKPEEVIPLVDAVGPQGLYILIDRRVTPAVAEQMQTALDTRIK